MTPEAIGDYIAGPNHVLPTGRRARFSSGLSVLDFMKRTSFIALGEGALEKIGPAAIALADARVDDVRRGVSTVGPHRDDLTLTLNGRELRVFGSAGQQRTAAIALRMLEGETLRERLGDTSAEGSNCVIVALRPPPTAVA